MTPRTFPRWFRNLETALWVLAAGAFAYHYLPVDAVAQPAEEGAAPTFTARTLGGDRVALADLRGEVVLVNFWATWCPPCRLEVPGFESVYRDYAGRGFTVLGMATDVEGPGVVQDFVRTNGITYPVAMATDDVRRLYGGVDMLPQSFLIDRHGRVRKAVAGVFSEGTLRKMVDELLAEEADR